MSQPARRPPSFDELYRQIETMPEGLTGLILEPGVLTTMSRPTVAHQKALKHCLRALAHHDGDEGGAWWILPECEVRLPGDLLAVPDVAGWRIERVPAMPRENPLVVVPDWACEVLSPTTKRDDRLLKLPLYARSGVRWIWLVDPELRSVEVYESADGKPSLIAGARDDDALPLAPFADPVALGVWWMAA